MLISPFFPVIGRYQGFFTIAGLITALKSYEKSKRGSIYTAIKYASYFGHCRVLLA